MSQRLHTSPIVPPASLSESAVALEIVHIDSHFFKLEYINSTGKTHIKEHVFGGFRLFLYIGCFLQNQPENVLKVFLKLFLKIKYCIDYQQMKSMCKHNILIN